MATKAPPLTAKKVEAVKPATKVQRYPDGNTGLRLEVRPSGAKIWRLRYFLAGKDNYLTIGRYPEFSLAEARDAALEARKLVARGVDPNQAQKAAEATTAGTFESIALEWHTKKLAGRTLKYQGMVLSRLRLNAFPRLGAKLIGEITATDILRVVEDVEGRGAYETASRVLQYITNVFAYAVATARADHNPARELRGALTARTTKHHPSIKDPKKIGPLLRAMWAYEGGHAVRMALRLGVYTFVRPGELRRAEWKDIDLDKAEWRIPAEKMKRGVEHLVPLSPQAVEVLRDMLPYSGPDGFVFPGQRTKARPMSNGAVNAALRALGYANTEITGHGFRSMASTTLNEHGWNRDWIERQLAHVEGNEVRRAYNAAQHLDDRRRMMQWWADYLDNLREAGKVIHLPVAGSA